jgi:RimJ/RimL family protein N-acetyltransferase
MSPHLWEIDKEHFTSPRLLLRKPCINDIAPAFALFSDPDTARFNPAGPHRSMDETEAMVERWIRQWEDHHFGSWIISLKEMPSEMIGFGGLSCKVIGETERINLGYRFATRVWGQGLATELAQAALEYGFNTQGFPEIWATARQDHAVSRHILEKIGMQAVDTLTTPEDLPSRVVYRLLRTPAV